ncbi:dihydrodipicolinate synthase family protein [Clostridium sp. MCC353]|uniref:dihydrodipicolinate synthase family protein n=1 Tax=Clostridium sp. MCC353 TaxID=2592646 RepID=UPI001C019F9D|nr:dihydrodipicolinate synthase family protein [Clostridium sp. MCC353]
MNNKERYKGIIPPLVTPLNADETLDEQALRRLIRFCINGGVSGVFVGGTSGEAMRVSDSVWEAAARTALDEAAGQVDVFCGAIDSSTGRSIEKIKKIEAMGGKLAVCTPTFYIKNFGQDEILRHYEKICRESEIEIAVYNIPNTTHVNILPQTIARLADNEKIVVYKDSCADWQQLQETIILLEDRDISVFNGAEELCFVSLMCGAQGCIPGLANFFPELFADQFKACREGRAEDAYGLQKKINRVRKCLGKGPSWVTVMKYLLELYGLGQPYVSSPLAPMNGEQKEMVQQVLKDQTLLP